MRLSYAGLPLVVVGGVLFAVAHVAAQQVTVTTPMHSLSESFFENMGVNWGLSGRNWNFSFGASPVQAAPQFGGFDPSVGANFGLGWRSGGGSGYFNGNFAQANRRSFVTQAPSITLQNGVPGFFADSSQSPFVISYIPVVGAYPGVAPYNPVQPLYSNMIPSTGASGVGRDAVLQALGRARAERELKERIENGSVAEAEAARMSAPADPHVPPRRGQDDLVLPGSDSAPGQAAENPADEHARKLAAARASSAGRPAPSVAEARSLHAAEQADQEGEALVYLERGRTAEVKGKWNVARVYYEMAARRASGQLRQQIMARLNALEASSEVSP